MAKCDVTLLLKGLLVLAAPEGAEAGKVGVLETFPPGHELTITVAKTPPQGEPEVLRREKIKDRLSLTIENGSPAKIQMLDKTDVDRKKPPMNPKSVRWFVDFENRELFNTTVDVNPEAFSSILTFNGGKLYTASKPNESILRIARTLPINFQPFGRVALEIGIDFDSATRAVFKNGDVPIFDSSTEQVNKYVISLTHDAPRHPPIVTDGNYYYTAVGANISLDKRIFFLSSNLIGLLGEKLEEAKVDDKEFAKLLETVMDKLEKRGEPILAGPEAACFPLYFGRAAF